MPSEQCVFFRRCLEFFATCRKIHTVITLSVPIPFLPDALLNHHTIGPFPHLVDVIDFPIITPLSLSPPCCQIYETRLSAHSQGLYRMLPDARRFPIFSLSVLFSVWPCIRDILVVTIPVPFPELPDARPVPAITFWRPHRPSKRPPLD